MDRVHETQLLDTLRDVYEVGAASVPYRMIYRWFGRDRITKNVWIDLQDRWNSLLEDRNDDRGWRLGYFDYGASDTLTLVCMEAEGSEDVAFLPISTKIGV